MGMYYRHRCDRCGYGFETSGPWTFFETEPLEHRLSAQEGPSPTCTTRRTGTLGMSVRVFCPGCRSLVNLVLAKHYLFPTPDEPYGNFPESIWSSHPEAPPLAQITRLPPCPHCGGEKFILPGGPSTYHRCPHCGDGTMLASAA